MPWKSPTKLERKRALLGTKRVVKAIYKESYSSGIRRFFAASYEAKSSAFFKPISNTDPSDWLLNHKEDGQTYEEFWKKRLTSVDFCTYSQLPSTTKSFEKNIHILPLGPFSFSKTKGIESGCQDVNPLLIWLESYCKVFFHSAKVRLLPAEPLENVACDYRVNDFTGRYQLNATDILGYLKRRKTRDQDCLVAVTMIDLFPKESWNFVFGLASASKSSLGGVGVFSFCRYEDSFYERWSLEEDVVKRHDDGTLDYSVFSNHSKPMETSPAENGKLLLRACKVMTHEVCHMFGMKHCTWMQCLMNGTNHLQESDRRPPHLCPVCLRKLQSVLNFDILERYKTLFNWTVGKSWTTQCKDGISETEQTLSESIRKAVSGSNPRRRNKSSLTSKQKAQRPITQTKKKKKDSPPCEPSPMVPKPPLESFANFRYWLHDAVEFITYQESPGFLFNDCREF